MAVVLNAPEVSIHTGMGNIVYGDGTAFRTWAPFASKVELILYDSHYQNNNEPSSAVPLAMEGNGYWSVDVQGLQSGQLYRFRITNRESNEILTKIDPYVTQVTNSVGKGIIREREFPWKDEHFQMPDFNSLVIYEMHLGTFADDPGDRPGNLSRAATRLPHLQELGINCVHVMPPNEFAADFSWGYNVSLPFAIEEAYGGIIEFKKFVDQAHSLGLAVVTGCLFNHFGPSDLDSCLRRYDGWAGGNGNGNGIYFYNDDRGHTDWGPRPDFGRPEVRQYIRDYAMFLLGECHCDGLRIDSTSNIWGFDNGQGWNNEGFNLLRWISDERHYVHRHPRHKILIAEDWHNDGWLTKPTSAGGAGMDTEWHSFVHQIRHILATPDDAQRSMADVAQALYARFNGDAFKRVIYSESHDESGNNDALARKIDHADPESWFARKRTMLGAAVVLTAPGIPMIWQGQEIFSITKFSDQIPLDWSRKERFAGVFTFYQDLCQLRRNWFNNTRGLRGQLINCHHLNDQQKIIAYHRWDQGGAGDDVLVILNFSNQSYFDYRVGLPRGGTWYCRFSSDWAGYCPDFTNIGGQDLQAEGLAWDGMAQSGRVDIGPYSALILSQ
ncbi:1,4-alpha-glucan branching enzyme [Candidatus Electrothrix aarhusensis]|uniref:1,4-alpha-glucan branching enzyme n=1 Tax=Candidatus Electrothrix aarhusensis TaxID=1859131 RepID=A0A444IT31_9BACT|nr:1,4-alpha-glucan branching enzyme [Candidatus Electrothrix aarhusensis]